MFPGSGSSIPLDVKTPQFQTPGDFAQQGASLQGLALGNAVQIQRLQEAKMQAAQMAAGVAANQTIQQAFSDNGGDYDKTRQAILGKVPLQYIQKFDQDHLENQRAAVQLTNERRTKMNLDNQAVGSEAAGLLGLDYDQRKAELPNTLARLQKQGIDTSQYANFDPTDDNLNHVIAYSNYTGTVVSNAQKQAQADARTAAAARASEQEKDAAAKAKQAALDQARQDAARDYLGVNDQQSHDAWMANLQKNHPEIANEYANLKTFSPGNLQIINGKALNAQQRMTDATSAERVQNQAQRNEDLYNQKNSDLSIREGLLRNSEQLTAIKQQMADKPKPLNAAARADMISKLADRAVKNMTTSNPNATWDDIIDSVRNPSNYADEGTNAPDMDANREAVVYQLNKLRAGDMVPAQRAAQINGENIRNQAAQQKSAPQGMEVYRWMLQKGGNWLQQNGKPDMTKRDAAATAMMAERQSKQPQGPPPAPILNPRNPDTAPAPPPPAGGRGATANKPTPPPDSIAAKVPEGRSVAGPDGVTWKKINGKLVQQ